MIFILLCFVILLEFGEIELLIILFKVDLFELLMLIKFIIFFLCVVKFMLFRV